MMTLATLDAGQLAEKAECEKSIAAGIATFLETCEALARIQAGKLYADEYATFEEYCREKWGMSRSYGYRLLTVADVASNLSPIGNIEKIIPNEAVSRELAKLEPSEQIKAGRILSKAEHVTAQTARAAVAKVLSKRRGGDGNKTRQERKQGPTIEVGCVTRAEVAAEIDAWWNTNRTNLLSYPASDPDAIMRKLIATFNPPRIPAIASAANLQ